jgi:hypothetical protein
MGNSGCMQAGEQKGNKENADKGQRGSRQAASRSKSDKKGDINRKK